MVEYSIVQDEANDCVHITIEKQSQDVYDYFYGKTKYTSKDGIINIHSASFPAYEHASRSLYLRGTSKHKDRNIITISMDHAPYVIDAIEEFNDMISSLQG